MHLLPEIACPLWGASSESICSIRALPLCLTSDILAEEASLFSSRRKVDYSAAAASAPIPAAGNDCCGTRKQMLECRSKSTEDLAGIPG